MTLDSDALAIARAGIAAVRPDAAVRRSLKVRSGSLIVDGAPLRLSRTTRVHLIAFGKAAAAMEDAAEELIGHRFAGGLAVLRDGDPPPRSAIDVRYGEHPVPGHGSLRAARDVLHYVANCPPSDLVLYLISGGGSAILEAPADGVSLRDLQRTTRTLLACGAPIQAMNVLRRHMSAIKGGRLGAATRAGQFATLAISDVVGDPPHDIASGPTVPDPTTFSDAQRVIARYALAGRLPAAVLTHLEAGAQGNVAETPKPGDGRLTRAPFAFAASNRLALSASAGRARALGYATHILSREVVGETRDIGRLHGAILAAWSAGGPHEGRATCLLSAGETTVTLPPGAGVGGRNQEFVLAAAAPLAGVRSVHLLSVGTDGIDGPTDAAGGWVDGQTAARARVLGIDLETALDQHATYEALRSLGQLVITGPTGTNVMDLHVGLSGGARGTAGSSRRGGVRSSRRRRS